MSSRPSVERIARVARALGDLSDDVVFIGGAIAPLLQSDPVLPRVRPTDDVDAIVASTSYSQYGDLEKRLRALGFKADVGSQQHVHRWRAPDETLFDLVPIGEHFGGTRGAWDQMALRTAVTMEIQPGLRIRHASAPGFLGLKWAAFRDRGERDPFSSADLEDIIALLVSRAAIVDEIRAAPADLREHVCKGLAWLKDNPDYDDLVAAHLGNVAGFGRIAALLRERIREALSA